MKWGMTMAEMHKGYAKALFMISEEDNSTEEINKQIQELAGIFEDNLSYIQLLSAPNIAKTERVFLLQELLGDKYNENLKKFLMYMCQKNIIGEIQGCAEEFDNLYREFKKISIAYVKSSVPLTEEQKEKLKTRLETVSGCDVTLECMVEEGLIGGVKVEMNGIIYDGSVKRKLEEIKKVIEQ